MAALAYFGLETRMPSHAQVTIGWRCYTGSGGERESGAEPGMTSCAGMFDPGVTAFGSGPMGEDVSSYRGNEDGSA